VSEDQLLAEVINQTMHNTSCMWTLAAADVGDPPVDLITQAQGPAFTFVERVMRDPDSLRAYCATGLAHAVDKRDPRDTRECTRIAHPHIGAASNGHVNICSLLLQQAVSEQAVRNALRAAPAEA
jgi:hypothetical protein